MSLASHHEQVTRLFLNARALPLHSRQMFLAQSAASGEVKAEVRQMLHLDALAPGFMAEPAIIDRAGHAALAHQSEPSVGQIGPYCVLKVLGEGSYAVVYLAERHEPVHQRIAIKLLRPAIGTERILARFETERQALARMEHPHIARLYTVGVSDSGQPYFVMEYVEGCRITDPHVLGQLSRRQRIELFIKVCRAVNHAHQRGIIHRDIKPSNILVSQSEEEWTPRIIDFGVAKAMRTAGSDRSGHTARGDLIGTLEYMSPEQLAGDPATIDTRTDIYALGVLLHEMLAGAGPLDLSGLSLPEAVVRVREGVRLRLGDADPSLRGDLECIVNCATAHETDDRYQTANELAEDLARHLRCEPVNAHPPRWHYRLGRWVMRNRTLATATAMVLIALVVAAGESLASARAARQQLESARRASEFLIREVAESLSSTAGAADVRKAVLEDVLARTGELLATHREDTLLRQAQAQALIGLGDIEREQGRVGNARERQLAALAIHERLARANALDAEIQSRLSINIVRVGDLEIETGHPELALPWYERSLDIDEQLVAREPANRHFLDNLTWSYERVGGLALQRGDLQLAGRLYQRRLEILTSMAALQPDNAITIYGLSAAHSHFAELMWRLGDAYSAAAHEAKALQYGELSVKAQPSNRVFLSAFADILVSAAYRRRQDARMDEAWAHGIRALEISRRLTHDEPAHLDCQYEVVRSCLLLATLEHDAQKLEAARAYLAEAAAAARLLCVAQPLNRTYVGCLQAVKAFEQVLVGSLSDELSADIDSALAEFNEPRAMDELPARPDGQ